MSKMSQSEKAKCDQSTPCEHSHDKVLCNICRQDNKAKAEPMVGQYKGSGEHSVRDLEEFVVYYMTKALDLAVEFQSERDLRVKAEKLVEDFRNEISGFYEKDPGCACPACGENWNTNTAKRFHNELINERDELRQKLEEAEAHITESTFTKVPQSQNDRDLTKRVIKAETENELLKKEIERLKEFEFMYKGLEK